MSGDIGIHEKVIILPEGGPAARAADAASAVQAIPSGVAHQYGPRVVIAGVAPADADTLEAAAPAAASTVDAATVSAGLKAQLDEIGAMGLEALSLRESPEYAAAKAARPHDGKQWDHGETLAPDFFEEGSAEAQAEAKALAGAPTSARLMGRVAVGIIIVEGPTADLQFSSAERTKVVAEVQNGLGWLGSQSSPAGVTWVYDIKTVRLSVTPGPDSLSFDQKETRWRDPAMAQLGYGAGMAGVTAYIENLRTTLQTNWSYCAFFTKYPVGWFAYASIGGPRLVMQYANDGWGPDNIDRVFAHESGHIFGAPDEYASSGCNCAGAWGWFQKPNSNCENCASGGGVACLMKGNSWEMCAWTPYHLGFPQGRRYAGVYRAGSGAHGLWVNADWNSFVAKWQQWSSQGLRLEDLEITVAGSDVRYSGAFVAGTDAYGLWVNADWNSFAAKWQEWSAQGLRLIDLEIATIGGQLRYSGVFRAGTGGYALWVNADWNSFVAKWQQWSGQGLRLVDLEIADVGGQPRYSGVFVAGTGGYGLWVNADWNTFVAKWKEWSGQGLRLVDMEIATIAGQTRYSGVYRAGTDGYGLWNSDWTSFRAQWEKWSAAGLRLINFKNTPSGIEAAFAPVGSEGYSVGIEMAAAASGPAPSGSEEPVDEESPTGFGAAALSPGETPTAEDLSGEGYGAASFPDNHKGPESSENGHGFGAASSGNGPTTAVDDGTGHGAMMAASDQAAGAGKARRRAVQTSGGSAV